ncbi:hypothetical protein CERZMDRAFT_104461 [Cercospora zeae-maydis SCOH1-5]|uniref:Uncharacterized protein n=1 Tax=Cercospora zeae-maydis SCOH1-5 TaxID=717836 RepID=A0A6A6FU63_9PEZI|nr:hypothetical protein CERZMDRAFT_104461 [Cercospora zeae-maydis SCOH1-5]
MPSFSVSHKDKPPAVEVGYMTPVASQTSSRITYRTITTLSPGNNSSQPYSNNTLLSITFRDPSKDLNNGKYCTYDASGAGDNFNIQITSFPTTDPNNTIICFGPGSLFPRDNSTTSLNDSIPTNLTSIYPGLNYSLLSPDNFNRSADYSQLMYQQGQSASSPAEQALMGPLIFQVYRSEDCSGEVGQSTSWRFSCENRKPTCETTPFRLRSFSIRRSTPMEREEDRPGDCKDEVWRNGAAVTLPAGGRNVAFWVATGVICALMMM